MHTDGGPNPPPDPLRRSDQEAGGGGRLIGLGFQFGAAIVLCVFIGQWADRRFGTDPWGVLVGAIVGFAVGFAALVREARIDGKGKGKGKEMGEG